MKYEVINKFVVPNRYHFAEKGTIARVVTDYGKTYYIQLSDNEIDPDWIPLALVLEKALEKQFSNPCFIKNILTLHQQALGQQASGIDTSIEELINT